MCVVFEELRLLKPLHRCAAKLAEWVDKIVTLIGGSTLVYLERVRCERRDMKGSGFFSCSSWKRALFCNNVGSR